VITKNQIKYIRGLALKKNRVKEQCFVVEGEKSVAELLRSSFQIIDLFATKQWIAENNYDNANEVSVTELARISNLKSANNVLAVVKFNEEIKEKISGVTLVLDDINDPGNLGTIIRVCDWFGVEQIVCSKNTVDFYNPKVVQSTMGSLFRVSVLYTDLNKYLAKTTTPIYGAFMDGENIKSSNTNENIHLVMGNEANGISKEVEKYISKKVAIKNIGGNTESLNVAMATAILLYEFCD
jgi:RNA methyltransferase, TrmH family|tara:strand:+ start:563 stop:1279 length:717 start_codon:yes stop_codon:yes gene_type:complete